MDKKVQVNGVNHLAISTADIKTVLTYFSDVLGMPLASLYWMHGVENTMHGFLYLNRNSLLAFVFNPDIPDRVDLGNAHAGWPGSPSSKGTMQHLALNVDSLEDLLAIRDRIRSRGIQCFGPMNHGMMQSIYFAGPDSLTLEVAFLTGADPHNWIDPEVVEHLGFTPEEMERLKNPEPFEVPAEPVQNPSLEDSKYNMVFPVQEIYDTWNSLSDEEFTASTMDNIPPTEAQIAQ